MLHYFGKDFNMLRCLVLAFIICWSRVAGWGINLPGQRYSTTTMTTDATTSSFVTPSPVTNTIYETITPAQIPLYYTVTIIPSTSTVITATVANINMGTGKFEYHFLQTKNFTMKTPTAVVP